MSRFVADCSVTMCWCFDDEANEYADGILERMDVDEAVVPTVWFLEVTNALLSGERRKRLTEADSLRFLEMLRSFAITIDDTPSEQRLDDIIALGRRHNLSSYDATYLDLAMRQGIPLATLDQRLKEAATAAGVTIFSP